jgi:AraC-like DNA-binding protein
MVRRLVPLAPDGLSRTRRGSVLGALVDDVDELQNLPLRVVQPLVSSATVALAAVVFIAIVWWPAALTLLVCLLVAALVASLWGWAAGARAERSIAPLRSRLAEHPVRPEITYANQRIVRGTPVRNVAAEVGWSDRHLTNRFRAEVGLRPKETARVARFDRARRSLHPGTLIAEVAAAHGYADQSHLVREFRALAGCTPSEWIADQFDFIQAVRLEPAHDGAHD